MASIHRSHRMMVGIAHPTRKPETKDDARAIEGKWELVSLEVDGKSITAPHLKEMVLKDGLIQFPAARNETKVKFHLKKSRCLGRLTLKIPSSGRPEG